MSTQGTPTVCAPTAHACNLHDHALPRRQVAQGEREGVRRLVLVLGHEVGAVAPIDRLLVLARRLRGCVLWGLPLSGCAGVRGEGERGSMYVWLKVAREAK